LIEIVLAGLAVLWVVVIIVSFRVLWPRFENPWIRLLLVLGWFLYTPFIYFISVLTSWADREAEKHLTQEGPSDAEAVDSPEPRTLQSARERALLRAQGLSQNQTEAPTAIGGTTGQRGTAPEQSYGVPCGDGGSLPSEASGKAARRTPMSDGTCRILVVGSVTLWLMDTFARAGTPSYAFEWWLRYRFIPAAVKSGALIGFPWAVVYAVRWILHGFRR